MRNKDTQNKTHEMSEGIIEGRNAVIEALKSRKNIESVLVAKGSNVGSITKIRAICKDNGVLLKEVDRKKLDGMSQSDNHQGVIAIVTPYEYSSVDDILDYAKEKGEAPFIIILDGIEDPHNLGSMIRTAEITGVHGIIIPKRRGVGVTPTVYKVSVGAVEHMKIAKVPNINNTIDYLKENNVWVYGADMHGQNCYQEGLTGSVAIVVGSEGKGISKLTAQKCDGLVKIPMIGQINSLNASVAGGILMYEVLRQKLASDAK